jgi:hypothetical protein
MADEIKQQEVQEKQGEKFLQVALPIELHKKIAKMAIDRETTIKDLVTPVLMKLVQD